MTERTISERLRLAFPEAIRFGFKTVLFLGLSAAILYLLLGATYPPIHDTVHDFRHALAVVPCH